jgi:hypothetical protein
MHDHIPINAVAYRRKKHPAGIKPRSEVDQMAADLVYSLAAGLIKVYPWRKGLAAVRYLCASRNRIRNDNVSPERALAEAGWENEDELKQAVFQAFEAQCLVATTGLTEPERSVDHYRLCFDRTKNKASICQEVYNLRLLDLIPELMDRADERAQAFRADPNQLAASRRKSRSRLPATTHARAGMRWLLRLVFLVPLALATYITSQSDYTERGHRITLIIWAVMILLWLYRLARFLICRLSTPAQLRADPYAKDRP